MERGGEESLADGLTQIGAAYQSASDATTEQSQATLGALWDASDEEGPAAESLEESALKGMVDQWQKESWESELSESAEGINGVSKSASSIMEPSVESGGASKLASFTGETAEESSLLPVSQGPGSSAHPAVLSDVFDAELSQSPEVSASGTASAEAGTGGGGWEFSDDWDVSVEQPAKVSRAEPAVEVSVEQESVGRTETVGDVEPGGELEAQDWGIPAAAELTQEDIVFDIVESGRNDGLLYHYDGHLYHLHKPRIYDEGTAARECYQRYRCSKHKTECPVVIRINGLDQIHSEDISLLSAHVCISDREGYWKLRIRQSLREAQDEAIRQGKISKFQWEALVTMRKFTKEQQKLGKFTLYEASRFLYDRSRKVLKMTPIPTDHVDWTFDETSHAFFRRDPTHQSNGLGGIASKPQDDGFLLHDENFKVKNRRTGNVTEEKIVIFGHHNLVKAWSSRFIGAAVDGTYHVVPKPFAQLVNLVFQVPISKDAEGRITRVMHVPGLNVLMTSHSKEAYAVLWRWVKNYLPDLALEYIMGDFEVAACAAFLEVFGALLRLRCYFHFGRNVRRVMVERKVYKMLVENANGVYRQWLRFLCALQYLPQQHVRSIYLLFKKQIQKSTAEHRDIFLSHMLPYLEGVYIGVPLPDGGWKEPKFPFTNFSRHSAALRGYIKDGNSCEAYHSFLKKAAGPRAGVYALAETLFYAMELTASRLLKAEIMMDNEEMVIEDMEVDNYIRDSEYEEFLGGTCKEAALKEGLTVPVVEGLKGTDADLAQQPATRHESDKTLLKKRVNEYGRFGKCVKAAGFSRYVHEDTIGYLKKNPVMKEFIRERVADVEEVGGAGYLDVREAGKDLDLGFPSLHFALRCFPFYEDHGERFVYLWLRKTSHLISLFGVARPFAMTKIERKAFLRDESTYHPEEFHFECKDSEDGGESDLEDAVRDADSDSRSFADDSVQVPSKNSAKGSKKPVSSKKASVSKKAAPAKKAVTSKKPPVSKKPPASKKPPVVSKKAAAAKNARAKGNGKSSSTLGNTSSSKVRFDSRGRVIGDKKTDKTAPDYSSSSDSEISSSDSDLQSPVKATKRKRQVLSTSSSGKGRAGSSSKCATPNAASPSKSPVKKVVKKTLPLASATLLPHPPSYSSTPRPSKDAGVGLRAKGRLEAVPEEKSDGAQIETSAERSLLDFPPSPILGSMNRSVSSPSLGDESLRGDLEQLSLEEVKENGMSQAAGSTAPGASGRLPRQRVPRKYVFYSPPFLRSSTLPASLKDNGSHAPLASDTQGHKEQGKKGKGSAASSSRSQAQ